MFLVPGLKSMPQSKVVINVCLVQYCGYLFWGRGWFGHNGLRICLYLCLEQSAQGSKRALPLAASVLKNPNVQEAVVDKGLEVMNKLVDKQLKIIDEAQEKASNFLAKNVSASANLGD